MYAIQLHVAIDQGTTTQFASIPACLDSLTELGAIAVHTEDDTPRWYIADLQKSA